ncbi:MAG: ATP-binding protein [Desulfitobacteriaceae bacterium]
MAEHYGTAVIPARVKRPKDKSAVEFSVGVISTWIIASLRNQHFFSIRELNSAIRLKLEEFNHKAFQQKQGNRKSAFLEEEKAYIQEKQNIVIMGTSGNGKSYISCAFGIAACRNYYSVKYIRLPDLLDELAVARGEGVYKKIMKLYKKVSLLILDEWLLTPLKESQAMDLLEIVEARHQNASTIFCTQFAPRGWHEKIGEVTLADAILDRIVHDSHTILIDRKNVYARASSVKRVLSISQPSGCSPLSSELEEYREQTRSRY